MRVLRAAAALATLALVAAFASDASRHTTRVNGRILFEAGGNAHAQAVTLQLSTRQSHVVRGLGNADGFAISPNGRYVAFVRDPQERDQAVWVAKVDGSQSRKLGAGCGPTWAPDSYRVAFASGENGWCNGETLVVANRDGSGSHAIYRDDPRIAGNPEWSPDGQWIAFSKSRFSPDYEIDLSAIHPDGSGEHVIASDVFESAYDWSPDARRLVFLKLGPMPGGGQQPDLYTVAVPGGEPVRLTNDSLYKSDLRWSPDGSSIAYAAVPPNGPGPVKVFLVGSAGGDPRAVAEGALPRWAPNGRLAYLATPGIVLTKPDGSKPSLIVRIAMGAYSTGFVWAPSGNRLLYSRLVQDSRSELFQIVGGNMIRRFLPHVAATDPSWSPSGAYLAFSKVGARGNYQLAILGRGAKRPHMVTTNPYGEDSQPTWSPDGSKIAFVRTSSWELRDKRALLVRRLDRGPARRLSDAVEPDHPAWSPLGNKIAIDGYYVYGDEGHRGLRLVDAATGAVTELTHPPSGAFEDWSPAWSPDGRELAFVRRYSMGFQEIRVVTVATGEERQLNDSTDPVSAYGLSWSPDGTRIAAAGLHGNGELGGPPLVWTMRPDGSDRRYLWSPKGFAAGITWQSR